MKSLIIVVKISKKPHVARFTGTAGANRSDSLDELSPDQGSCCTEYLELMLLWITVKHVIVLLKLTSDL